MLYLPRRRTLKRIHRYRMTGERLKRQRRDKLAGVLRHHHIHIHAPLLQQAKQLASLICSNAPGDTEDNACFLLIT